MARALTLLYILFMELSALVWTWYLEILANFPLVLFFLRYYQSFQLQTQYTLSESNALFY